MPYIPKAMTHAVRWQRGPPVTAVKHETWLGCERALDTAPSFDNETLWMSLPRFLEARGTEMIRLLKIWESKRGAEGQPRK